MPFIRVGSHELYVEVLGDGPAVVMHSGLGGDHRAFALHAKQLAERFRVVVFDPRDAGRSAPATAPYSTADMAADIAGIIEQIDAAPAHVVGHSLGGMVAQELAIERPELVRSLILVSTHAGATPWRAALVESWITLRHRTTLAEFTRCTLPWLVAPGFYNSAAQIEGLVRFADRHPNPQSPDAFERQARAGIAHETAQRLGEIRHESLVLVGQRDIVNPPEIASIVAHGIPRSQLHLLPEVGHLPHIEQPTEFRQLIERWIVQYELSANSVRN
jgi:pimeloyl-ACP methyl ester carboxylesterase